MVLNKFPLKLEMISMAPFLGRTIHIWKISKELNDIVKRLLVKLKDKRHISNVGVRMKWCEVFAIEWISQPSTAVMEEASQDK